MPVQIKNLQNLLQTSHPGFAYQLLALQIQIQNSKQQKNETLIQNLSKLIQLYMLGVQVLESNWDKRYKYFNDKIQSLMKKKHIIQELHMASTGHKVVPKQALVQANKQSIQNRKNQHEINVFVNTQQFNIKKVQEIIRKQENKISVFKSRLKITIDTQQNKINQRIQRRKMKSQCYSQRRFQLGSNPPQQKMKQVINDNQDIFGQQVRKKNKIYITQRKGSAQKKKTSIKV